MKKRQLTGKSVRLTLTQEQQIELLIRDYGWDPYLVPGVANIPVKALDEMTAKNAGVSGDVSGGSNPSVLGDVSNIRISLDNHNDISLNIRLSDLSLNKDVSSYNTMYSFTFNYDPKSLHNRRVEVPVALLESSDEVDFWRFALGDEKKKYKTYHLEFQLFSFIEQYEIFKKHFKRWLKNMNDVIPYSVVGYTVCIERTKNGILHAHAVIYSDNNYAEMCCTTARSLWASVSKGRVCAMKNAFAPVKSGKQWVKYVTKDLGKNL